MEPDPEISLRDIATFPYDESDVVFEVKALKNVHAETNSRFDTLLEAKWQEAMDEGLFRFSYNPSMPHRHLPGRFGFFLEVRRI